jgi:ABC-2 type transport system permease protein
VLARPFKSDIGNVVPGKRNLTDFYAPAAVILLVQQFGIAFGALSFVREQQLGTIEVLRAGPVGAFEALLGKYLAYLALGGVVAAGLVMLVVQLLDVPMTGGLGGVAGVLAGTLFASVGLGFVISLLSKSDAQAVQYTMIALLASLFFSGFFLTLAQLTYPAKILSWLLPSTFGIRLLRDGMLRGVSPNRAQLGYLLAYGVAAFVLALLGTRRRFALER